MFKAVIFDWDGTLADTRQAIVISFQKALSEINCKISSKYIERRIGIGAAETFREILQSTQTQFNESLISRLVKRKSQLEIELTEQVNLFEGAKEILEALNPKVKIGLASMNNHSVIVHMLKAKDLERYFKVVLTAESISYSKPNPEIFLKTATKLKTSPRNCLVVEDSLFGVRAAKSAKMSCVAVTTGAYSEKELKGEKPDLIVKTLKDSQILDFILQ